MFSPVAVVVFVAYFVALLAIAVVRARRMNAWGGMGATFGPMVVLSLYWRRFNTAGAMAGMLVGFALATLWQFGLEGGPQGVFDIMPATPGCVAGAIAAVVATLRTAPPSGGRRRDVRRGRRTCNGPPLRAGRFESSVA